VFFVNKICQVWKLGFCVLNNLVLDTAMYCFNDVFDLFVFCLLCVSSLIKCYCFFCLLSQI
jgi:hypothetical protein